MSVVQAWRSRYCPLFQHVRQGQPSEALAIKIILGGI